MVSKTQPPRKRLSSNYSAELIARGFTLIPYGELSADACFFDESVLNYSICPFREFKVVIGKYSVAKGNETETASKGRVEFEVVYDMKNPFNIQHAARLRGVLKEIGVAFSETPDEEARVKMAKSLEEERKRMANALEESLR